MKKPTKRSRKTTLTQIHSSYADVMEAKLALEQADDNYRNAKATFDALTYSATDKVLAEWARTGDFINV
jgi:hypothetical protein